ncbi:DNA helicase RecG, partial [Candidatus Poribacteria bacterium]
ETLIHTKRIVPKYALTAKLTAKMMRSWMRAALDAYGDSIPEILPWPIRKRQGLIDRQTAINEIHFPTSEEYRLAAQKRLAFDEFFLLSLGMELKKNHKTSQRGIPFRIDVGGTSGPDLEHGPTHRYPSSLLRQFLDSLPFELTGAQKRVFNEIRKDMQSSKVMNRLLQGDVGSGKTVVAAMALLVAIQNGYQGALMVPTEILAEQHYNTLSELLTPLGLNVVLLKSDLPKASREAALTAIADGTAHLIVGTQALIQDGVDFHKLGLAITDEQHRFGVMQRATLRHKGQMPDVLVMTATPIPRTLSLTLYGDLNLSVIDELPPGRKKIETTWVKENERQKLYAKLEREVRRGKQAYLVYPLVEESEKLEELKAATSMAEHFQNDVFPHLRVGLLHGQMKAAEKQETMAQFKARQIDILVATTVIEVGIDVPNATLMVIEHAERFGLAQLHQLRGRVGRGRDASACYLVATPKTDDAYRRVQVMVRTNNGFEIAEEDLSIRGPGEFFGTRQSGIPNFKIANILKDANVLEAAKKEAARVVKADAKLNAPEHQLLKHLLQTSMRAVLKMASIG